jgi:hypothetical protein
LEAACQGSKLDFDVFKCMDFREYSPPHAV